MLKKRRSTTIAFKLHVIHHYESSGKSIKKTARKLRLTRKMVRSYIKQKQLFLDSKYKRKTRKMRSDRVSTFHLAEQEVLKWMREQREKKL